ncbi:MAG TPA: RNA 2',3'-cyclic phosphodiesterase [Solirubrobacteraceae bacterium]|nr:RNA 2',3'-cyclic phosphodiesterase [Solirubrobacteraceae bacterium]
MTDARLFVALELPDAVRAALSRWSGALAASDPTRRAVAAESLHLTLCFLGDRPLSEVDAIGAACARAAEPPVLELTVGAALNLPPRRPRVIAVRIEDRSRRLAGLQERISRELVELGVHEPEPRPFLPHVTVARVRRGQRAGGAGPPGRGRTTPRLVSTLPFTASTVTLFRSLPALGGARYEALRSAFLERPA